MEFFLSPSLSPLFSSLPPTKHLPSNPLSRTIHGKLSNLPPMPSCYRQFQPHKMSKITTRRSFLIFMFLLLPLLWKKNIIWSTNLMKKNFFPNLPPSSVTLTPQRPRAPCKTSSPPFRPQLPLPMYMLQSYSMLLYFCHVINQNSDHLTGRRPSSAISSTDLLSQNLKHGTHTGIKSLIFQASF